MGSSRLYHVIVACLSVLFIAQLAFGAEYNFEALSDSIQNIEADYHKQAEVTNLTIDRGGVKFELQKGILTLAKPILGKPIAAVFKGKYRFMLTPPNSAEQYMLQRLCKVDAVDWALDDLTFFFTDSTYEELQAVLSFDSLKEEKSIQKSFDNFIKDTKSDFEYYLTLSSTLLPNLVNKNLPGQFRARLKKGSEIYWFVYEPNDVEEVNFYKRFRSSAGLKIVETISSYHSPEQYVNNQWGPDHENKDIIDSLEYEIYSKVWQSAKIDLEVKLSFISNVDGLQAINFSIFNDLHKNEISVTNSKGDSLFWLKHKEEYGITVFLNSPLQKGERGYLIFKYSSKRMLAKTPWGNNVIVSSTSWYPKYGYLTRAKYKLKFEGPEQYTYLSVGKKTNEYIKDGFKTTEWDISDYPVAFVSYNYGLFEREDFTLTNGVPVEIYCGKSHTTIKRKQGIHNVGVDVTSAANLFSTFLSEYPFEKLLATEIQSSHGQGLPGFLHLSWVTYDQHVPGEDDLFRAHEVAHQWWGHIVGWESYHDQWLSEGFAEYMAAWYILVKYKNDETYKAKFFEIVDNWIRDITESGSYTRTGYKDKFYHEGNEAGPIWMGYRLRSSKSADYFTLVYSKGAYVLHMLRMLMFDFNTQVDSRFFTMLRDFVKQNYWKEVSTADFIKIAEKHYGGDLSWFFDQYVYGIQIPKYTWSTSVEKTEDGKYEITVDVTTKDVDDDFQMLVPLTIVMEGDFHTTARLLIDSTQKSITLPKVPYKPINFVFNSYKSVLCKEYHKK